MRRLAPLFTILALSVTGHSFAAAGPQNVVVIVADDLGWSDLGCYGADLHETPNLDQLAREGVRFTQAYAAPVCSPTRASLLTGKHWARLGITVWIEAANDQPTDQRLLPPAAADHLPHSEVTLAEHLKQRGYLTFHVGKWHLGNAPFYPESQGFDVNIGGTLWGMPATYFHPFAGRTRGGELRYVPGLGVGKPEDYLTDRLTDEALRLIDEAGDQPFYLNLWYHSVHTPIQAKQELVQRYRQKLRPELQHQNATYAAMVHSLDDNIGRVLHRLKERSMLDRTLVVFLSDNGGVVGEYNDKVVTTNAPLRSGKGSLYEGGIRVPWIMRGPGIATNRACDEPVVVMDLLPTVIARCQDKSLPGLQLDGVDLSPVLAAPDARLADRSLNFHYPHYYSTTTPVSAVRDGDWKLLSFYEDDRSELYHLPSDAGETRDLSSREPALVAQLQAKLHGWLEEVGARMPVPNTSSGSGD